MSSGILVIDDCQTDLLEVIGALYPPRRFPGRLHGRQEQPHQDADDGNHHQQLDQGKTTPPVVPR